MKEGGASGQLRIATPEGVPITLELGGVAERLFAFLLDILLVILLNLVLLIGAALTGNWWLIAFALSLSFVIRVFYFVWYEARPRGSTPGKRRLGLRVVRADGGPMSLDAVLTRNFTRELEVFVPLSFLIAAEHFWPGHSGWARLGASFWFLAIATMPLWSRSRMRLGDLVAGTRVVRAPRTFLLADLARRSTSVPAGNSSATTIADAATNSAPLFLPAQLTIYGIYELQVLEDVLRKSQKPGGREAMTAVARRIQAKIVWDSATQGKLPDDQFLERFYAAQRQHLEQQLLFGKRKERKQS